MPAQILEGIPSFGQEFARAIGGGFSKGVSRGLAERAEAKKDIYPTLKSVLKGADRQLNNLDQLKVYHKANEYREKGYDDVTSSSLALNDLEKGDLQGYKGIGISQKEGISGEKPQKVAQQDLHHKGLPGFEKSKTPVASLQHKELFQLSKEQLESLPREEKIEYLRRIRELAAGAVGSGILSGATLGLSNKLAKNMAPEYSHDSLRQEGAGVAITGGELIGQTIPLAAGLKLANWLYKAKSTVGRALQAGAVFGVENALRQKIENGEVEPGDVGIAALSGAGGQLLFEKVLPWIKGLLPELNFKLPKSTSKQPKVKENLLLDYAVKEASQNGVSVQALQQGDPHAIQQFTHVLDNIKTLPPSVLNETISRSFAENNLHNLTRRAEILEDQLQYAKRTKYLASEIAEEEARVAKKNLPVNKRPATVEAENAVKLAATKEMEGAVKRYTQLSKELGRARDQFSYMVKIRAPIEALEQTRSIIERLNGLNEEAHETVRALQYEKNTGKPYKTQREIDLEATNNAAALEHKVATRPELEITRPDSRAEDFEKIKGKRVIPGTETLPEDTQTKILKAHIREYEDKLRQLEARRTSVDPGHLPNLNKAIDTAQKLIEQNKNNLRLHERRKALRDVGKTVQRREKLKGSPESNDRIQKIVDRAIKDPTPENVDKAHEELYGKEEAARVDEAIEETIVEAEAILSQGGSPKQKEARFEESQSKKKEKINFRAQEPKPNNAEQQKRYINFQKLIQKLKPLVKVYRKYRTLRYMVNGFMGYQAVPTVRKVYQTIENNHEAKKLRALPDYKRYEYQTYLKKTYGPKRAQLIKAISEGP